MAYAANQSRGKATVPRAKPKEQAKVPMPPLDTPYNPLNNPHNHFKCSIKFRNDLPEVPVDTKILVPPLHPEQLAAFKLTTLERELRQELQTLPGLGIPVTVLNTHNFSIPDTPQRLHEDDEALLAAAGGPVLPKAQPGRGGPSGGAPGPSRTRITSDVSWLMRTSYISRDVREKRVGEATRGGHVRATADAQLQAELQDLPTQIAAIERSFEVSQPPPVHPTKPSLRPVAALPLLPNLEALGLHYVDVVFDDDPAHDVGKGDVRKGQAVVAQSLLTEQLYDVHDEKQPYVAMLTPRVLPDDGAQQPLPCTQEFDYKREYKFRIRSDHTQGANFVIQMGENQATYIDINTRLELKRPGAEDRQLLMDAIAVPDAVVVRKRHLNDSDVERHRKHMRNLHWDEGTVDYVLGKYGAVYRDGEEEEQVQEDMPAGGTPPPAEEQGTPMLEMDDSGEDEPGEQEGGADRAKVAGLSDDDEL